MRGALVVIGDALLDRDVVGDADRLCPDAPVPVIADPQTLSRPGGAALAAVLAAQGHGDVVLVTALGDDEPGTELRRILDGAGVTVVDAGLAGSTPQKIRIRAGGQSVARIDRGATPSPIGSLPAEGCSAIRQAGGLLVSDYGRGMSGHAEVRELLGSLDRRIPVVWDPHLRGAEPVLAVQLATPSEWEAAALTGRGTGLRETARAAEILADRWGTAVAVTLGQTGALMSSADGPPFVVPARPARGDECGAGDCFAAWATIALARGAIVPEAVQAAVERAAAYVARGGAAGLRLDGTGDRVVDLTSGGGVDGADRDADADAVDLAHRVRRQGGTVVAAGGCFDVLHSGHISYLQAARSLGDALVVCLNSDASVRRLKGRGRPLLPAADRVAMLLALECVDAVHVFDGDTPADTLAALRPHVFAKGADYRGVDLPEAEVLERWGGQVVVLPYVDGRSTTRLIHQIVDGHAGADADGDARRTASPVPSR